MKVYIAGSSYELERVRAAMALVRSIGAEVAFDWTEDVEQLGSNPLDLETWERAGFAKKDLDAIDACDLVWLLAPIDRPSRGACVEFGYALAKGKLVLLTGPYAARRATIFFDLAWHQHDDEREVIDLIEGFQRGVEEWQREQEAE